ncbi:hypothetical protein ACS0TY_016418 [Phlomoides rotata]
MRHRLPGRETYDVVNNEEFFPMQISLFTHSQWLTYIKHCRDKLHGLNASKTVRYKEVVSAMGNNPLNCVYLLSALVGIKGRQAWQKLGVMPPEEAMEKYIDVVTELYPTWLDVSSIEKKRDKSSGDAFSGGSKGPMGPVFSSFVRDEEPGSDSTLELGGQFVLLGSSPVPQIQLFLISQSRVHSSAQSQFKKHIFNKISNADIVSRIRKIATEEKLDVESDSLELIASNADSSIRDAETMIDQLSLFGKRITVSLVNELIGVVSDEKLLDLLELAMSSNAETVIEARELMDTGVDPMLLMSQLATLIVDIIAFAGTYPSSVDGKRDSFFGSGGCKCPSDSFSFDS